MLEVYVDGATIGNPGPSGVGVVLKKKNVLIEKSYYIGTYSNHEAELIAVIKGLQLCKELYPDEILSIRSDSKLVVDMIEKAYTKNKAFSSFLNEILVLMPQFPYCFIKWIPDSKNNHADRLARNAIRSNR
ncbi:14.7 kDa ribonuclease H-like protein [Paraliobacillus sp. PM-2]|uniref:ribonuclease HI family protein n=1 Tax=Paraliobacillus sp. PM-2 TaxID=1462524 RepID=UPI00061C2EA5|nr:ribonuclease HI family protein [Paraliobacillus sp. PM-2]CQR46648.1 14.7 kDa ribonuclease H-like protein [Paraliobacillus sp. PM-2]